METICFGPDSTALPAGPPRSEAGRTVTSKHLIAAESDRAVGAEGLGAGGSRGTQRGGGGHSHSRARGAGIRSTGETGSKRQEVNAPHALRALVETPGTPLPWHLSGAPSGLEGSPGHQGASAQSQPLAKTRPQALFRGTQREAA